MCIANTSRNSLRITARVLQINDYRGDVICVFFLFVCYQFRNGNQRSRLIIVGQLLCYDPRCTVLLRLESPREVRGSGDLVGPSQTASAVVRANRGSRQFWP